MTNDKIYYVTGCELWTSPSGEKIPLDLRGVRIQSYSGEKRVLEDLICFENGWKGCEIKERLNKLKNDDFIFFIKNNFNFSKSFFKFYINKLNQVRDENLFIILSLLIPNRKELAPEALELILNNLDYNQEINEYLILQIKQ